MAGVASSQDIVKGWPTIRLSGVSTRTDLNTGKELQSAFTFLVGSNTWRCDIQPLEADSFTRTSIFFDGSNICSRILYDKTKKPPQVKRTDDGVIYATGGIPLGNGHIQGLWLAFYPKSVEGLTATNFPNLVNCELFQPTIAKMATLSFDNKGMFQAVKIFGGPESKPFLNEEFSTTSRTNFGGTYIATSFIRKIYGPDTNATGARILVQQYGGTISNIERSSDPVLLALDEPVRITDLRFGGVKSPIFYSNSVWPTTNELMADPILKPKAQEAIRRKTTLDVEGNAPVVSEKEISHVRVIVLFVLIASCLGISYAIFRTLLKSNNHKHK